MAEILAEIKILPQTPEDNLEDLIKTIKAKIVSFKVHKIERKPIAFGLEAIHLTVILPDASGGTTPIEQVLTGIDGISEIEVVSVRRLL
jgi:elongation factor 1-beta